MSGIIRANTRSFFISRKEIDAQNAILKEIWVIATGVKRKRNYRTMYDRKTLDIFLSFYNDGHKNLDHQCLEFIFKKTNVTKKRIQQWFANKRIRDAM